MAKKKKAEAPKKEAAPKEAKEPKKDVLLGKGGEDNPGSGVKIQ